MLRETKAGGGEAQEGAGKAEQGCLRGTGMALASPAGQGRRAVDMGQCWGGGRWFQSWGALADNPTWQALPRGLRGQQEKPEHRSLQRWLWKAKPLSPPFHSPSLPPPGVLPRSVTSDSASLIFGSGLCDCSQSSYEGCMWGGGGVSLSVHRQEPGWAWWTLSLRPTHHLYPALASTSSAP